MSNQSLPSFLLSCSPLVLEPWAESTASYVILRHLLKLLNFSLSIFKSMLMAPIGDRNGNPLQYSCVENPMDRGIWGAIVHGVAKSQI